MSFDNTTNRNRALKIVDIIDHVEKSARSNRADASEIAQILAPAIGKLREIGAIPWPDSAPESQDATARAAMVDRAAQAGRCAAPAPFKAPQWATVRDMASEASLSDLSAAMAIYLSRVDALISDEAQRT